MKSDRNKIEINRTIALFYSKLNYIKKKEENKSNQMCFMATVGASEMIFAERRVAMC